jgi:hypothetical protein
MTERLGTLLDNLLQNDYQPRLRYQIERGTVIFEILKGKKIQTTGRQAVLGLQFSFSWGTHTGVRGDVNLPTPQSRDIRQANIELKRFVVSICVDRALLKSGTESGAFEDELKSLYNTVEATSKIKLAQECYGDSTGVLATLAAVAGAGPGVVISIDNAQYMYVGMPIVLAAPPISGPTFIEATTVTAVDRVANTITCDLAVGASQDDLIALGESATVNNFNGEIQGLLAGLSRTNTYLGLDRTLISEWQGIVFAQPTATTPFAWSEAGMKAVDSEIRKNVQSAAAAGYTKPYDYVLTTFDGHDALYNSRVDQQRFVNNGNAGAQKLQAGFSEVEFRGVPVIADALCPSFNVTSATHYRYTWEGYTLDNGTGFVTPQIYDLMFFINTDKWNWYTWDWLQWANEGGSILYRKQHPTRTDEYYADFEGYMELATDEARCQAVYAFNV